MSDDEIEALLAEVGKIWKGAATADIAWERGEIREFRPGETCCTHRPSDGYTLTIQINGGAETIVEELC